MDKENELVMYLIFRGDLKMSKGKIAAQAGHAVQMAISDILRDSASYHLRHRRYERWTREGITKVALRVPDGQALAELRQRLVDTGIHTSTVVDEGRTEVEPGSETCMAIEPMTRNYMSTFLGKLPLL